MASFKDLQFNLESSDNMLPGPTIASDSPRTISIDAIVKDAATMSALEAEVINADFYQPLGMNQWVAVLKSGDDGILEHSRSGQAGEVEQAYYGNAILTNIASKGGRRKAGVYRVQLTFTLPDLVG